MTERAGKQEGYFKRTHNRDVLHSFPALLDAHVHFEIGVGVIDVKDHTVESPDLVAERIRNAAEFVKPERLVILPQPVAFAKLQAMVQCERIVRQEISGSN